MSRIKKHVQEYTLLAAWKIGLISPYHLDDCTVAPDCLKTSAMAESSGSIKVTFMMR